MMRARTWTKLAAVAAACVLVSGGCEDTVTVNEAGAITLKVIGKVISRTDGQPVAGAEVTLCGYGTTLTDPGGMYQLELLNAPDNVVALLKIEAPGFAVFETNVALVTDQTSYLAPFQNVLVTDFGTIDLKPGVTVTVLVTRDMQPLGNTVVFAEQQGLLGSACGNLIIATTDASGIATLSNLDAEECFDILVPAQDLDGVGGMDFDDGFITLCPTDDGTVVAINVISLSCSIAAIFPQETNLVSLGTVDFDSGPIADTDPTADPYGNADLTSFFRIFLGANDESSSFSAVSNLNGAVVTSDGSVSLLFDVPTVVPSSLTPQFTYLDNLVDLTSANFDEILTISATAAGSAQNTLWTFTPASPLPPNETFMLEVFVQLECDPAIGQNLVIGPLYRPDVAGSTVAAPTLDNYNGRTNDPVALVAPTYLQFGELVSGIYKVLEIRDGTTIETFGDPNAGGSDLVSRSLSSSGNNESIVFNETAASATAVGEIGAAIGTFYRVRLQHPGGGTIDLADHTVANPIQIILLIAAADAEGNRFDQVVTLNVQ